MSERRTPRFARTPPPPEPVGGDGYTFTDPIAQSLGMEPFRLRRRVRNSILVPLLLGCIGLALVVLVPAPERPDRLGALVLLVTVLVLTAGLLAWRRPPAPALLALPAATSVAISALIAISHQIALEPVFYLWPILVAAYFFRRREVALTFAVALGGFAVALLQVPSTSGWVDWLSLLVVAGSLTVVCVLVKEELVRSTAGLQEMATHDPLTSVLNRRAFLERVGEELARSWRTGTPCALAIIDVDHFKAVNDEYGHRVGDDVLRQLTRAIQQRLRRVDALGRLGGEEFGIILSGTDRASAMPVAEELRGLVEADVGELRPITISIGVVANADVLTDQPLDFVDLGDRAMYRAKQGGRNRVAGVDELDGF